jgi:hypothetical protein
MRWHVAVVVPALVVTLLVAGLVPVLCDIFRIVV